MFNLHSVLKRRGLIVGLTVMIAIIALMAFSLLSGRAAAQSGAAADTPFVPPSPPPLHINAPTPTPEPGAAHSDVAPLMVESRSEGRDLHAIPFRPGVTLNRNAPPPVVKKPASSPYVRHSAGEARAPEADYQAPNVVEQLSPMAWNLFLYEGFEGAFPGDWLLYDNSNDGYERSWGDTDFGYQVGSWSAWPAAGGADALDPWVTYWYTDNLNSWLVYGPLDFSSMVDIFVSFGLYYDTEPEYDWMYFCLSVDGLNYNCDYWAGDSGGWTDQAYWLTSYAGYSQVWLAWVFISDSSVSDYYWGPYVDEIYVWGDDGTVPPTPTPDPSGSLLQNGSFETGDLTGWNISSTLALASPGIHSPGLRSDGLSQPGANYKPYGASAIQEIGVVTPGVEGLYSVYLARDGNGEDFLFQPLTVPADVTDLVLNYWFGVTTAETGVGRDFFCAGLYSADLSELWVDMGCEDSTDATGYWQEVLYTLSADELAQVQGQTAVLMFEMYNTGEVGSWSAGWVDYARVYATGGTAGGYLDPNEPNGDTSTATTIACGQTITGVVGDALGGYDVDWFILSHAPSGWINVDLNAQTLVPPSALDSVVGLWDISATTPLTWNDDDGVSFDSYISYTNAVTDSTFYVSVEAYGGEGSPDSPYEVTIGCNGNQAPPTVGNEQTQPPANTWTVMLYLNAEDPGFESILTQYRTNIESFIGSKQAFLKVAILYDGSGNGDTTRYLVQPGGSYADGVNRWAMGEVNMGAPDTLADFVTWAMDQYPAENYYLAVDDHGDGAYGISFDATSNNDQLTAPELYSALKSATRNGARKIDIFDYEACLMGMTENVYDVREWVDYVVFFEQISWGINTYPRYFSDLTGADTPLVVGQRIVDRYHAEADAAGYPHTISLIDTAQMDAVRSAVSALGNALQATGNKTGVNNARDGAQGFAADSDATNPMRAEYIDLWDLASRVNSLAATQAAAVRNAVDAAVVRERHSSGGVDGYIWNHSGAHGLSVFYPTSNGAGAFSNYTGSSYYQMSRDGTWDEFLSWVLPASSRRGMGANRSTVKFNGGNTFVFKHIYLPLVIRQ